MSWKDSNYDSHFERIRFDYWRGTSYIELFLDLLLITVAARFKA
jgi:hypothetical protein